MNKRVEICCKSVTTQLFTVVGLIVEPSTAIEKPKSYIQESVSVR